MLTVQYVGRRWVIMRGKVSPASHYPVGNAVSDCGNAGKIWVKGKEEELSLFPLLSIFLLAKARDLIGPKPTLGVKAFRIRYWKLKIFNSLIIIACRTQINYTNKRAIFALALGNILTSSIHLE